MEDSGSGDGGAEPRAQSRTGMKTGDVKGGMGFDWEAVSRAGLAALQFHLASF